MAKVGDVVLVPAVVRAVHEQGYPSGLDKHGRPLDPTEQKTPDTLDVVIDGVGGSQPVFVSAGVVSVAGNGVAAAPAKPAAPSSSAPTDAVKR